MTFRKRVAALAVLCAAVGLGGAYLFWNKTDEGPLKIYGSVDMRTVSLAFEESGRLEKVLAEEGQAVKAGEAIAYLQADRYAIALSSAEAALQVRRRELELLLAGSRDEEIKAARATHRAYQSSAQLNERICQRQRKLGEATAVQLLDQACSQAKVARAQAAAARENLQLLLAGTRPEQIEVARANVELAVTQKNDAARALRNCTLVAPSDGVIRSRMKERGDMVSAATTVYELALMDPLWVRAWVDEINLGRLTPGQTVKVYSDSFPGQSFEGTVGFVSTVAEFTPKTVQTEALRTALVYEVRVTVRDPLRRLRLGMPATVEISD